MEITQKHQNLIESIVRKNLRFSGNEDLVEDFCSETIKRSYMIISSLNNIEHLESYLNKVATSAILEVLKNYGRLKRSSTGYVQTKEAPLAGIGAYEVDCQGDIVYDIPDPATHFENNLVKKEYCDSILSSLFAIDAKEQDKSYFNLFNLRYVKNLKQAEIAKNMNISQGEVSKRLVELATKIASLVD